MKRKTMLLVLLLVLSINLKSLSMDLNCSEAQLKCIIHGYKYHLTTPNDIELTDLITMVNIINKDFIWSSEEKRIKVIGYANIEEYKKDKKIAYKRAERLAELMGYYGLDKEIKISIEGAQPELSEKDDTVRYQNRKVEIILLNGKFYKSKIMYLD